MCEEEHGSKARAGRGITRQKIVCNLGQFFHRGVSILNCTNSSVFKILLALFTLIQPHRIEKNIQCRTVSWMRICIHVQRFLLLVEVNTCSPILPHSRISNGFTIVILPLSSTNFTCRNEWIFSLVTVILSTKFWASIYSLNSACFEEYESWVLCGCGF